MGSERQAMGTGAPERPQGLIRFFDRLVRRALGDLRLPTDGLADYLASLLARFARTDQLYAIRDARGRRIDSVVGLRLEAERAWDFAAPDFDPFRERRIRQQIGDYTLFMTGVFRSTSNARPPPPSMSARAARPIGSWPTSSAPPSTGRLGCSRRSLRNSSATRGRCRT